MYICIVPKVSLFLNFWTFSNIYAITFKMHRIQGIACNRSKKKKAKLYYPKSISWEEYAVLNFQLSLHDAFFMVSTRAYACRMHYVKGALELQVTATFDSCRYQNFERRTCCWTPLLVPVSDLADTSAAHTCRNSREVKHRGMWRFQKCYSWRMVRWGRIFNG